MHEGITEKNIIQHELIGLQATILDSPCKNLRNITGEIVDETMNTFKLEYLFDGKQKVIMIPKHKTRFKFAIPVDVDDPNGSELSVEIDGSILTKRPEDRIKKLSKLVNRKKVKNQNFFKNK